MSSLRSLILCLLLCGPSFAAQQAPSVFTNETAAAGIFVPPTLGFNGLGRGSAWDDFDGDGDLDVFAPGGGGGAITIFWNNGNGTFSSQVIAAASAIMETHLAAVSADFDNDGDADVFLCNSVGPDKLFVNQGGGTFAEEAGLRGLASPLESYCASWGDYDRDGWLDLYVGVYNPGANGNANLLYRNDGSGNFIDVSLASGANVQGYALSVMWHDVDEDGWPDIHVGNDKGDVFCPNALLRNHRNGTFTDVAALALCDATIDCMGIAVGDLGNDGDWDVFLSNNQLGHVLLEWEPSLFSYKPQATWYQTASDYNLQTNQFGWGTCFLDYDCDGILDLFVMHDAFTAPNRLFRGAPAGSPFIDDTFTRGIATAMPGSEACCAIDYDDDGDLDLWMSGYLLPAQLVKNPGPEASWLRVELEGTISNRDAFGAVVICRSASGDQMRMKTSGGSFLADGDKRLHFGLGADTIVSELEIRWPSGTVSFEHNVAVNQQITLVEPRFTVSGTMMPGTINQISMTLPSDAGLPYISGVTIDTSVQTPLGDGRFIRFNLLDPIYQATTTPGNWDYLNAMGVLDATGSATMSLFLPPIPQLTGFPLYFVAGTGDPSYAFGLKSLVAPNKYRIQ